MIELTNFNGNPNVGLFAYCNDKYCLVGTEVRPKDAELLKEVLGVPVHRIRLAGTSLIGVFASGTDKLLLPSIVFDDELKELDKLGIEYEVLETRLTALGNNIMCSKKGVVLSSDFEEPVKKQITKALDLPVEQGSISGLKNVGSLSVVNNGNCIVSRETTDEEIEKIEQTLKVTCTRASLNRGLPYLKSGIIVNNNGMVVSGQSTGIEISDAEEALGLR